MRRTAAALMLAAVIMLTSAFAFARANPPTMATDSTLVFPNHGVHLGSVSAAPGDTQIVVARWTPASDGLGSADSYRVVWRFAGGTMPERTEHIVTTLDDRVAVLLPPMPDSMGVRATVWAIRRSRMSVDSVWSTKWFRRTDAPPPPPGPVILDTLALATDSVRLFVSKSSLTYDDKSIRFVPGTDTAFACAIGHSSTTNTWHLAEYGVVIRGTGKDTVAVDNLVHFPQTECSRLIAAKNGPPLSPGYYPVQWERGTTLPPGGSGGEDAGQYLLNRIFKIT